MNTQNPNQRELIETEPSEALELYLEEMEIEQASQHTIYSHKSRLGHFIRWCQGEGGIDELNDLTGRDLQKFKAWRRNDGDLNRVTVKTQSDTLRVFIRFCEGIDAVTPDLSTVVRSPDLEDGENQRSEMLEEDRSEEILEYLQKYEYGSKEHTMLLLMWHSSARVGAIHALDIEDYDSDNRYLQFVHRPESETPLKNKNRGERTVTLSSDMCGVLDDYICDKREDVEDEYGRNPMFTSSQGRLHKSTLRGIVYRATRPCVIGNGCPHDRDPDSCEATGYDKPYKCPSSVAPHAVRRGSITAYLRDGDIPSGAISDRANVSERVMEKHYSQLTDEEKAEKRRDWFA